jgi:hypothetical protein
MALDLNSTNIVTILVNISCCINDLSEKQLLYANTGNTKCFREVRDQMLVLDRIYDILNQNYNSDYKPTECFTTEELEELYQKALNICKLCNCN